MNSKQIGNLGIAAAISYFINNLYVVSIPLNDSQDYDLIVDKDGIINRIEVKTSGQTDPRNGKPIVSVRSCGGTKGTEYSSVANSSANLLFVHHLTAGNWLIPVSTDMPKTAISLDTNKYNKYKVS